MNINNRVCVVTSGYNDIHALTRHLHNLLSLGLFVIFIDGKFRGFEGSSFTSTDGTIELVKSFQNTLYMANEAWDLEELKVEAGFKKANELGYEYVIWLGADEYLEGDIEVMLLYADTIRSINPEQHLFNINVVEHNPNDIWNRQTGLMGRLFHDPINFQHKHTHWSKFYKGKKVKAESIVGGIVMHHDDTIRPNYRNEQMLKFQDWNVLREIEILHKELGTKIDRTKPPIVKQICPKCNLYKAFVYGKCVNCSHRLESI